MATRFDDWEGQYLEHYGVLGMKWGQRRYQNPDGSLTAAGKSIMKKPANMVISIIAMPQRSTNAKH